MDFMPSNMEEGLVSKEQADKTKSPRQNHQVFCQDSSPVNRGRSVHRT